MEYKNYIYLFFSLLLTVLVSSCKAQEPAKEQYVSIYTDLQRGKLKGPVKKVRAFRTYNESELTGSQIKLNEAEVSVNAIKVGNAFERFDRKGHVVKRFSLNDSINQTYNDTIRSYPNHTTKVYISIYEYKQDDYNTKAKITQPFKINSSIFNPHRVHLNKRFYKTYNVLVNKDSSYKKLQYIYTYKTNTAGRITNEIVEMHWDDNLDDVVDRKKDYYTVDYVYNDKSQLVKKVYNLELKALTDSYKIDHDLYVGRSKETPVEVYTYDAAGNLTSVYTYLNPQKTVLVFSVDYFYNAKNQLVRLKRRKATGMMGSFNTHFKRLNEFFFNDKGDVVKVNSYENNEKNIHATYLYDYKKYDKYGNWLQLEMRIKDIPTKEPTRW